MKLTVAQRLGLGFGSVVAIGVGIVGFSLYTLSDLSEGIHELAKNRMVKVTQFNDIKENQLNIARHVRNIIINTDPAFVAEEKRLIADLRAKNSDTLDQLAKTVVLPQGQALLKQLNDNRGPYNAAMDQAVELALKGEQAAAGAYLLKEARARQDLVFKAVDESADMQQTLANELAEKAQTVASFSVLLMSGLALLMAAIGTLIGWLLTRNLRQALGAEPGELSEAAARVAEGDLSRPVQARPGDATSVLSSMAKMQASLAGVVANVRANSESVATASAQIAQGNADLSQRTEEQASALQQTAATMEQLGTTVRNNTDSAKQANQLAQGASQVAAQGGEVVGRVVDTMQGISESSRRIGDIIGVIDGIAFQTNILALNAAVEAARAGEQGRGFAVVAGEVRTLAQRSAEAAKEIKGLIGRSVEQVEQGTLLVDQAGKTMGEIVGSIRRVSDIVAEITSASVEQSSGISQIGDAVGQMDQVTQQNAALVEESAAAAESLRTQAQQLVRAVAVFKLAGGAHGGTGPAIAAPAAVAAAPAAPAPLVERRGPNRATNVTRPAFKKKAPAVHPGADDPAPVATTAAKTGSDDWTSF